MRYLLDTNIISNFTKPAPSELLIAWMAEQSDEDLFIASLTLAEIRKGVLEKPPGKRRDQLDAWFSGPQGPQALFAGRILSFDEKAGLTWAELMAEGKDNGRPRSSPTRSSRRSRSPTTASSLRAMSAISRASISLIRSARRAKRAKPFSRPTLMAADCSKTTPRRASTKSSWGSVWKTRSIPVPRSASPRNATCSGASSSSEAMTSSTLLMAV